MKKILLLFLFIISYPVIIFSQQYNFKNYTSKNGLADNSVNNIFQDSKGYIWYSTQGGLSRFDGKKFISFTKEDGLIDDDVTFTTEDKNGNIWIATREGVSRFDGIKFTNYSEKEGLPKGTVYCILCDKDNTIWFAVKGKGVIKYDGKKFKTLNKKDGLTSNDVYSIVQDKVGNYWFVMKGGVSKYDNKKITDFSSLPIFLKKTMFCSFLDSKGDVWFGGVNNGAGVIKYDGISFNNFVLPDSLQNDFIGSITEDNRGNMWFATEHGVLKYEEGKFHLFSEKQGLLGNYILSLTTDYEDNLWIGTLEGATLFNNESFVSYSNDESVKGKGINCLFIDVSNENYLLGTDAKGLTNFNSKSTNEFNKITGIKEIEKATIFSITKDERDLIWIGAAEGIFVIEKIGTTYKLIKDYTKISKEAFRGALKIIHDSKGNTWVASSGYGLLKIGKDKDTIFSTKKGFASDNLLSVFEDSKSNIWIGTLDKGLIKYNGNTFKNISEKEGFTYRAVASITEDKKGNLYFGTDKNGLIIYDGKSFKSISILDGLCSNSVESIQWDNFENCLWVGTTKGINKISFTDNLLIDKLHTYKEQEGFKGDEINMNNIAIDKNGLVWFGSKDGLYCYNRKYDKENIIPTKLHTTQIRLGYKFFDWKNYSDSSEIFYHLPINLKLPYDKNSLTFYVNAFTTNNVNYTYKLEGYDNEWSPLTEDNKAVFTNIPSGKEYTFKVKALNSKGIWTKEEIFSFSIKSPWWQTLWFYSICVLIVLLGVYSYIKIRASNKEIKKQKLVVEEKNREITQSIEYALRIQTAILPPNKIVKQYLENSFILYKPKDIVAGDFYWMETIDDLVLFAACDCTGHGVPGAMVSVVCHNALNRAVREFGLTNPAAILDKTAEIVIENFSKSEEDIKDGMDISLCAYNSKLKTIQWAGANNPIWVFKEGELIETKADKQPIGMNEDRKPFTNHTFNLNIGDTIYLFTDGFADQFGGETGQKKLTKRRFKELLKSIQDKPLSVQGIELDKFITNYSKQVEQIDDILVIGVKI